jgi:hypothetical protein
MPSRLISRVDTPATSLPSKVTRPWSALMKAVQQVEDGRLARAVLPITPNTTPSGTRSSHPARL